MLLYHGFPRGAFRRFGQEVANEIGVRQLGLIKRHGLLLTPEWLQIPENPLAAKRQGEPPKTRFVQRRACFTLVERPDLWMGRGSVPQSHAELFGPFGIGLKSADARRLGAVPVYYMYHAFDGCTSEPSDINVSRELLFNLRELRSVAIALARIEAKAAHPQRRVLDSGLLDRLGYVLEGDPEIRKRVDALHRRKARNLMWFLDTDRNPAWSLVQLIDIMFSLFQTTDFADPDQYGLREQNAYYRQREWRIVHFMSPHLRCQRLGCDSDLDGAEAMTVEERRAIRDDLKCLNGEFFDKRRLNESALLRGTRDDGGMVIGREFFSFVEEVICPYAVAPEVASVLGASDFEAATVYSRPAASGETCKAAVFTRRSRQ